MARHSDDGHRAPRRHSPAKTPEEREGVLINKSLNLVESQIDDGTVSATVLAQYVKLGSSREALEQERLANENAVLRKKLETMEAAIDVRNLMEDALSSFRGYTGQGSILGEDDFDEYE
jgi:hypothetical protein